jgi:hypothetical protein
LDKLGVGGSQRWVGLMRSLARQDGVEGDIAKKIASMWGALREKLLKGAGGKQASAKKVVSARPYVLLVVPPVGLHFRVQRLINAVRGFQALSFIPWECLPLFDGALVTRVPSFHTFENLLHEIKDVSHGQGGGSDFGGGGVSDF